MMLLVQAMDTSGQSVGSPSFSEGFSAVAEY
jgi:hypothetical protein